MKTIYKMTREDKRALRGHLGHMVLHLSAGDGNTTVSRFPTLHMTRITFVPKRDGVLDFKAVAPVIYEVDDCGTFECLSDAVFVLKTTGRLPPPLRGPSNATR